MPPRKSLLFLLCFAFSLAFIAPATAQAVQNYAIFRLYNPYSGEHLYTASTDEVDFLVKYGWRDEGVGWYAPQSSKTPVYRLYNPWSGDHHYTTKKSEYDDCADHGWRREGIGWYSDDAKGVALYRGYNRFETVGTHHYTTSWDEMADMVKHGWSSEGVGWYGAKSYSAQLYVYGSGDGVPVYSYTPFFVYVKSNDAASISEEDLALDATDGSLSDYIVANATYKDIAMKNSVSNVIYSVNRVDGGFVGCVMFKSSGTKTIQLKEDGTVIGTLKVNVSDGTKAADDWMNKVIASVTTSKMNAYEKFYAVVAYLRGNFRYDTVDSNCKDILLAQYETPYWVSYRWDSYTSPAILCKFAEKIGGLSPHNCYYDGVWSRHAYITITWNGKTEYVTVCPATSTGIVSYSTIDFTKLNNVLHFNPDALVGLKKVSALSDDIEVQSDDEEARDVDEGAAEDEAADGEASDDGTAGEEAAGEKAADGEAPGDGDGDGSDSVQDGEPGALAVSSDACEEAVAQDEAAL